MGKQETIRLYKADGKKTIALVKLEEIYNQNNYAAYNLFTGLNDVPIGLSSRIVWDMVHGNKRQLIQKDHLVYLIRKFLPHDKLIDSDEWIDLCNDTTLFSERSRNLIQDRSFKHSQRINFLPEKPTYPEMVHLYKTDGQKSLAMNKLQRIYKFGKYGPEDLLVGKSDVPVGLSSRMVWEMVRGNKWKYIPKNYLDYLIKNFLSHDRLFGNDDWISLPDEKRCILVQERDRTDISPAMLLRRADNVPTGLTGKLISDWMDGRTKTLRRAHLQFVISEWKKHPDSAKFIKKRWLDDIAREFHQIV